MDRGDSSVAFRVPDGSGIACATQPRQIVVDHQSPYLKTKKRPKKTWFSLYVLGSGFVAGWKRLAFATGWGIFMCFLMDKWLEVDYPLIFPISTLPFTIATFILGPLLGLFINYNSNKFIDAMKFYKSYIMKATTIATTYAAGMRGSRSELVNDVRYLASTLCFVMKHQLRRKSTLKAAPLYPVEDDGDYIDDPDSYHGLTHEQACDLKRRQNELNRWACDRGLVGAKYDQKSGRYTMAGVQVSKLPWPYALRLEALNLKVSTPTDIVALLQVKIDNSIPTAGIPPSIINALMGQMSSMNDVFASVKHLRNTRVPVVVSNILYLGIILYLMFLPFVFWDFFRWFSLIPYLLIAFFMLGLLSATEQLASPFGRFQTSNAIYRNVGRRARVGHTEAWRASLVADAASTDIEGKQPQKSVAKK